MKEHARRVRCWLATGDRSVSMGLLLLAVLLYFAIEGLSSAKYSVWLLPLFLGVVTLLVASITPLWYPFSGRCTTILRENPTLITSIAGTVTGTVFVVTAVVAAVARPTLAAALSTAGTLGDVIAWPLLFTVLTVTAGAYALLSAIVFALLPADWHRTRRVIASFAVSATLALPLLLVVSAYQTLNTAILGFADE